MGFCIAGSPLWAQNSPPSDYSDEERAPNIVEPLDQFGTFAGSEGGLAGPEAVAFGPNDEIFVLDTGNHRIEVFTPEGKRKFGWGKLGSQAGEFLFPGGLALGSHQEVVVADTGNRRIQIFSSRGEFLRQWPAAAERPGESFFPSRVCISGERVYLLETGSSRIRVYSLEGKPILAFGRWGEEPGALRDPSDLAVDAEGVLYVVDAGNHRVQTFTPQGEPLRQWGTWGTPPGFLSSPQGIVVTRDRVFVADSANHRIEAFDRSGDYLCQWGAPPTVSHGGNGRLHFPRGISVDPLAGRMVVCEPLEHRCQVFSLRNARKVTPVRDLPWWDNLHARYHLAMLPVLPMGATLADRWGRNPPLVAAALEQEAHMLLFFDISLRPCFLFTRIGGMGRRLGEFRWPSAVAGDPKSRRYFVLDGGNRRIQRIDLTADPASFTGFASMPKVVDSFDPTIPASQAPSGYLPERARFDAIAVDPAGDLLVADGGNSLIARFDPRGFFEGAFSTAGAAGARFRKPVGLAVSPDGGTIYLADQYAFQIVAFSRKGDCLRSWGDSGPKGFRCISGIAAGQEGALYVTDSILNSVRKFSADGSLIQEWGRFGSGEAEFSCPMGITCVSADRIVVDDFGNHRGEVYDRKGQLQITFYKGSVNSPFQAR